MEIASTGFIFGCKPISEDCKISKFKLLIQLFNVALKILA